MTNDGYNGGTSYSGRDSGEHKYRTADDDRKYVSGKISRSGKVEVVAHRRVIHDRDAPRSSEATSSEHYKTQDHKHRSSRSHR